MTKKLGIFEVEDFSMETYAEKVARVLAEQKDERRAKLESDIEYWRDYRRRFWRNGPEFKRYSAKIREMLRELKELP